LKKTFIDLGFLVLNNVFSDDEVNAILEIIASADKANSTCRKSDDLFAIRKFFKEIPQAVSHAFNENLINIIVNTFGDEYFVTKSIYFDKPKKSNWFVAYHQDLTISVDKKIEMADFGPWTTKHNQFAVQPPLYILENNFTIRIHLDDTTRENGALRVIPGSHRKGVYRPESIDWKIEKEHICEVNKGGIMIMHPLLLHSSSRTTNNNPRRVIHVEFSKQQLPDGLFWSELLLIKAASNIGLPPALLQ